MNRSIVRTMACCAFIALGLAVFTGTPQAAALRQADVGDPINSLTSGLTSFASKDGQCGPVHVTATGWVVPGRPLDEDHASVVTIEADGRTVAAAVYDEANLEELMDVYADLDGRGAITHKWPGDLAPDACRMVAHIR